jgi:hypothetical protein
VFIDGTDTSVYISMLSAESVTFLMGYVMPANSARFHQGDARPHTNNAVLHFLRDIFEEKVVSNQYPTLFEEGFS